MLNSVVTHEKAWATHTKPSKDFWSIFKRAWYGLHNLYSRKYLRTTSRKPASSTPPQHGRCFQRIGRRICRA